MVINLLSILAGILLICVFVIVHEVGHYGAGRLLGFHIQEFAIGMGPKIFSRRKDDTLFCVRLFPIGGMCKFYGEDEAPDSDISFNAQSAWKRLIVILAGPFMNAVFAILLAITLILSYGDYMPAIAEFNEEKSVAMEAGMMEGDVMYAVNGVRVKSTEDLIAKIRASGDTPTITIIRNGEYMDININGAYDAEVGYSLIGITVTSINVKFGFFESVRRGANIVSSVVSETFKFFGRIFEGDIQQGDVMGVVGTVSVISQAVRVGLEVVMYIAVLLSVSLALLNVLPLPALDGGRAIFILIEMLRGKPVPPEREGMVHFVGLVLLLTLVVFITFSDIRMLIGW